jgi:hypothetical protein
MSDFCDSVTYYPRELGVNSLTVTATPQNSSAFGIAGRNQLTLVGQYTRVAGTNLSFTLQISYDLGSTWNTVQTEEITGAGSGTFDSFTHNDDDAASKNFVLNYPIWGGENANMRIGAITCTAGTTDTLTLTAIVDRVEG